MGWIKILSSGSILVAFAAQMWLIGFWGKHHRVSIVAKEWSYIITTLRLFFICSHYSPAMGCRLPEHGRGTTTYQPRNRPIGSMFQHRNGVIPSTAGFLRFLLICLCLISVSQQKGDQTMNNTISTTLLCGPAATPSRPNTQSRCAALRPGMWPAFPWPASTRWTLTLHTTEPVTL